MLSSEIEADGVLGPSTYLRTLYALRAYREHPFRTIIVTGGGRYPDSPVTVADAMRNFLIENGVPAGVVLAENRSADTRENALFSKDLLPAQPGTIVLMTSDFHMFRARRTFEKVGVHVVPRPIPDVLKRSSRLISRWTVFWVVAIETAKIVYYTWSRWM